MFERLTLLQQKWRKHLVYINWAMVLIGLMVSLLPIFLHCNEQRHGYPSGFFADLLKDSNYSAPVNTATVLTIYTDDSIDFGFNLNHAMIVGPFLGMVCFLFLILFLSFLSSSCHPGHSLITLFNF